MEDQEAANVDAQQTPEEEAPQPGPEPQEGTEERNVPLTVVDSSGTAPGAESGACVRPARFVPFAPGPAGGAQNAIDLLYDVQLELSVELGRAAIPVRDVLQLGPGSVVELNKLGGEPVDILVNGRPIAKGEVVVVDENFGVRVTEILNRSQVSAQAD